MTVPSATSCPSAMSCPSVVKGLSGTGRRVARVTLLVLLGAALSAAAFAEAAPTAKPLRLVHTALADVAACLPLRGGQVLAATAGGLVLVDTAAGLHASQVWTSLDGLPGTRAHALRVDRVDKEGVADRVHVGTEGGLARLQRRAVGWRVSGTLPSKPVRAMARHDGALWLATWGDGLLRSPGTALRRQRVRLVSGLSPAVKRQARNLTALTVVDGELIAASAAGTLWAVRKERLAPLPVVGLPKQLIWHLYAGADGLLVATIDGLFRVMGGRAMRLLDGDVRAIASHHGQPLAAVRGGGLRTLGGRNVGPMPALRLAQGVAARGSDLCAATAKGLWLHRDKVWLRAALAGLPEGDVAALAWQGDALWAGTYHRGLHRLQQGRWQPVAGAQIDRRVNALVVDRGPKGSAHRALWVGTARGLFALRGEQVQRWRKADGLPADDVHALAPLSGGGVAVGTASGAALLRGRRIELLGAKQGLPVRAVWALTEDAAGGLWLGSSWGLYQQHAGKIRRFSVATGHLSDDWVTALATRQGRVWVGTYRHGVDRLDLQEDGSWQATALGGGWINLGGLRLDADRLLAATMDGLKIKSLATGGVAAAAPIWQLVQGAAPGRDVTATVAGDGQLWVASRRGIAAL